MKKLLWTIVILIILAGGYFIYQKKTAVVPTPSITVATSTATGALSFTSADGRLTFEYPSVLSATQNNNIVTLHHEINYENHDACDFKGDAPNSPTLSDFHVTMHIFNMNIASTAATFDPSIATSSLNSDGTLAISSGYIDPYNVGVFNGYQVTEGVEGCGYFTYYLPITPTRTLVVQKQMIGAFSSVADPANVQKILAVPGVISPEQSDLIFTGIMQSLQAR